MARRAYKPLWLRELQRTTELKDRVGELQRVVSRQRAALAAFGDGIIARPEFGREATGDIALQLHEFVAFESTLQENERYIASDAPLDSNVMLFWRNRRVLST